MLGARWTCLALLLVVAASSVLEAQDLAPEIELLSVSVIDVKLIRGSDGQAQKNWAVKVFIRNAGSVAVPKVDVGLTAWTGKSQSLPSAKRYLRRRGHSIFQRKAHGALGVGKTGVVVFRVKTKALRTKVLFGALADCGTPGPDVNVAQVTGGRYRGSIVERDEKNNYRERRLGH